MSDRPSVDIAPDGAVLDAFIGSRARVKFIQGPVGSGKTTAAIQSLMVNALGRQPVVRGRRRRKTVVVRNTYKQLVDTVIPSVREMMPEDVWGPIAVSGRPRRLIRLGEVEWEWLFYAADKPEDVQDFKSLECSDIWLSEYRYLPREIVTVAVERTGRFPNLAAGGCAEPQVIGETNAPTEGHWSSIMSGQEPMPEGLGPLERGALVRPEKWQFFLQPPAVHEVRGGDGRVTGYVPNPAAENLRNLPPDYYLDAIAGKADEDIRSELMNRPARQRRGKPVWASFRRDTHVATGGLEMLPGHPVVVGQDFGRTPASVFAQVIYGSWRVLGEYWAEGMGARAYADALKGFMATRFPGARFALFGDPAGEHLSESDENSPMLMFRAAGLRIVPAPTNDVTLRLNAVDQLLRRLEDGRPALLIDPSCRRLIAACDGGYMYRRMQTAGEQYSDLPTKDHHSHIADAFQYAVIGGGEGRALLSQVGPQNRPDASALASAGYGPAPKRAAGKIGQIRGRGWAGLMRR